ncbi:SDR family NAD(P)-dependent oxidoreductase [Fluviispira sanaruensis]|uniref:SDR family NAD(P)-dependent oxidoreductase n=1 Tax=Fluviispira sanaruensis TaxID=2493639 RepID=A0A4P2VL75_FLUSA|nr:SDR family oxidoreductase [Fluviispira sanaruensis]BBH54093.1 SDR family NAD(P)-dependent oxidoreductase [Fluviispira sanaruensis]
MAHQPFQNKNVLVTGSSKGIGCGIANEFLKNGANVCYTARTLASFQNTQFPENYMNNRIVKPCDFTLPKSIASLRQELEIEFRTLDILVCNVGTGNSSLDTIPEYSPFNNIFDQNFNSAVNTVREFLSLLENAKGCILFIGSICGQEAFDAPIDYSVAKSALHSFSKHLSKKIANKGIRVNCLALGNIYFPGGTWDKKMIADPSRVKKMIEQNVPMKRFGTLEDVANASLFLCSEKASFITGSILTVDGGQTNCFH